MCQTAKLGFSKASTGALGGGSFSKSTSARETHRKAISGHLIRNGPILPTYIGAFLFPSTRRTPTHKKPKPTEKHTKKNNESEGSKARIGWNRTEGRWPSRKASCKRSKFTWSRLFSMEISNSTSSSGPNRHVEGGERSPARSHGFHRSNCPPEKEKKKKQQKKETRENGPDK